ncbi:MAG: restriction endonuclease [Chloroflexi bacterium]|nr:restriction endonuclease [Chloroflexota bacterium]
MSSDKKTYARGRTVFENTRTVKTRQRGGLIELLDDDGNVTQRLYLPNIPEIPREMFEVRLPLVVSPPSLIQQIASQNEDLYRLMPEDFERLVAELLNRDGWEVELTARTKDDNIDVFAFHRVGGIPLSMLVQCKRYAVERKIGIDIVRSVIYTADKYRTNLAMIATSSSFTTGAIEEKLQFQPWRLDLRDHNAIIAWCLKHAQAND